MAIEPLASIASDSSTHLDEPFVSVEEELRDALVAGYYEAGRESAYWANYFIRDVKTLGARTTAKKLLRPTKGDAIPAGLQSLIDVGRTDIALEHVVLQERFRALFTDEELAEARRRVEFLPTSARTVTPPGEIFPETLPDARTYIEGHVRSVLVNVYERDARARAACLRKHGTRCKVCNFGFEERYGELGRDFIHVHHTKPLALCRDGYEVNPEKDLVPVCPNCHAMLHSQDPPLSVNALKNLLIPLAKRRAARGQKDDVVAG